MEAKDNPYPNIPTLDGLDTCYDAFNKGKKAGIKEAVEWFRGELGDEYPFDTQLLDDKLEEWGIDG